MSKNTNQLETLSVNPSMSPVTERLNIITADSLADARDKTDEH